MTLPVFLTVLGVDISEKALLFFNAYGPKILSTLAIIIIGYFVIKVIIKAVERFFDRVDFDRGVETFIENIIRVVIWIILSIMILANVGVDVSALVAGLGIMGFIVGFALKDTLGNLAAGVFILFQKPFRVGEWIRVGSIVGGVEKIGIAACILKSPDNIKITIPNGKIWSDTIENFTANDMRKIYNLTIGISYSDDIGKAIKIINKILDKDERVLKEPEPQVVVKELGDSSINIAVRPAVKTPDYWSVFFHLNKTIKEEFDKQGITIPFPQRDVHLKKR
ncbi:MAG: mechanosensitive ion channel [bacterium]|nr:mechanosensitive ion channel [bacterium]